MDESTAGTRRMMRESGKLSILTLASRILGLIRDQTRAAFLGTDLLADAFSNAFMVPNLLRRLFGEGSMAVALIPTTQRYLEEGDREKTEEFLSSVFTVLTIAVGATVLLGIAMAPWFVRMFRSDPSETAILTRIMFPFLALVSVAVFLQGILNAYGVFAISGIAPILFNLCFILIPGLIVSFSGNYARAMAISVVVGGFAQALCQLPSVLRRGARFGFVSPAKAFRNPGTRQVLSLIAPTVLGLAAYEVNGLVSTVMASRAGTGVVTALQFSLRLQELILGLFVVSVATVLLPELTGLARNGQWGHYAERLRQSLDAIALVTVPLCVFAILEREDIVVLLFKAGKFTQESVNLTTNAFFFHSLGLFFIAMNRIISPAFYAKRDTKSPAMAGIASFGVNIALVFILAKPMGGGGIALSLSLASFVNTGILVAMLFRMRIPGLGRSILAVGCYALKLLAFSAIAGLATVLARNPIAEMAARSPSRLVSSGVPLVAASFVFAGVGVILLAISGDRVAGYLLGAVRSKSRSNSEVADPPA